LGVIGSSPGNGHPYSWSAICNGYDPKAMESCGYPSIPRYLEQRSFPEDQLDGARVTVVWTQDPALSDHIAAAARIPRVVSRLEDMIGQVDAVLLARDDPENRMALAKPFLDAGVPLFIDKPLARTRAEAEALFALERHPGQIFTCSCLRFLDTLRPTAEQWTAIGGATHVDAVFFHDWEHYAVHAIEPVLAALPDRGRLLTKTSLARGRVRTVSVDWENGPITTFTASGTSKVPLRIRYLGPDGVLDLAGTDNFTAFKAALARFVAILDGRAEVFPKPFVLDVISVLEGCPP
jgi:hypothetical protein